LVGASNVIEIIQKQERVTARELGHLIEELLIIKHMAAKEVDLVLTCLAFMYQAE